MADSLEWMVPTALRSVGSGWFPVPPPDLATTLVAIAWRQMASPVLLQSVGTPLADLDFWAVRGSMAGWGPISGMTSVRLVEQIRALPHVRCQALGAGLAYDHRPRRPDPSAALGGGIA